MKKSIVKKTAVAVVLLLIIIQFFGTKKNSSTLVSENAIEKHYTVTPTVQRLLKRAVTTVIPTTPNILGIIIYSL
jgi:hypothetical protein